MGPGQVGPALMASSSSEGGRPSLTAQRCQGCGRGRLRVVGAQKRYPTQFGGQGGPLEASLGLRGGINVHQGAISPSFSTSLF